MTMRQDLVIERLTVRRGPCPVVDEVTCTAAGGAVTALIGPNGAGKSTILKAVLGLLPSTGSCRLGGVDLAGLDPRERARRVAYVPQRSSLTAPLSVRNVVAMGRFAHQGALARLSPSDAACVEAALAATDADAFIDRRFIDLSAGEQQRVLLARALATGAPAICLDEPSSALDIGHALALDRLLRRLADEGRTILVVLHQPAEVRRLADHAILLHRGRVQAAGSAESVLHGSEAERVFGVRFEADTAIGARAEAAIPPTPAASPAPVADGAAPARAASGWRWADLALLAAALVLSTLLALAVRPPTAPGIGQSAAAATATTVTGGDGTIIPVWPYRRIASCSIVADSILIDLVEPGRFVAASADSRGPDAIRLGDRPRLADPNQIEAILAHRPDLLVINSFPGQAQAVARLTAAGVPVLDLGPARGAAAAERAFRLLGSAVGRAEQGERMARTFRRRLAAAAAGLPADRPRLRAVLVTPLLDKLYGGAAGTSYSDVITAAGLIDAASEPVDGRPRYVDWPDYTAEMLLAMDPDIIVTNAGSEELLRALPGLARLRAVRGPGRIIGIDQGLLANAGPLMVEAAEALHQAAYGDP
jgi:ABC-type cobalamin/Fe3+-siderophores transport system ATPase subunit/ABC-type Fe3+-hydroxamate transport system substrate-binding protein